MSRAQLTSTVEQNTGGAVSPYVAGKNFLINGGFDIWQRGTSGFSTLGAYTADRWFGSGANTITYSQETTLVPTGFKYAVKFLTSSTGAYGELYQAIENQTVVLMAGKTVTLSGYVLANSTYTGNAVLGIQTNTTVDTISGGTWTEVVYANITPSTSTWQRFSVTYTIPSTGIYGVRVRLGNTVTQNSGAALYWAGVQLEIGSVATPFSRAGGTLSGELDACQRYYYRVPLAGNVGIQFTFSGNATMAATVNFPTVMRATPTGFTNINSFTTSYSPTATQIYLNAYYVGNLSGTFGSATASAGSTTLGGLSLYSWTSPTTGLPYSIYGGSSCYLDWSAEL